MAIWLYVLLIFAHGVAHVYLPLMALGVMEPPSGADWVGNSWLLSALLQRGRVRQLMTVVFGVAMGLFFLTAIGLVFRQGWSRETLTAAVALSSLGLLVFWDGHFQALPERGALGLAINVLLLVGLYGFGYPGI